MERSFVFQADFFNSGEYKLITGLGNTLFGLLEEGAYIQRGERTQAISSFGEAIEWLTMDAMKGHYLQRYKGLGEMNPDQLWETTMNPETRRMLQVTIDDAIGAEQCECPDRAVAVGDEPARRLRAETRLTHM